MGNSGTTTRLLSGILVGQPFESKLSGDESLNSRPMKRIIDPLTQMGANISSILRNGCAPLYISPGSLHGIHYNSPVASAQVKSCILLAGLYADGETSVTEPSLSRNHTELMLKEFGADIRSTYELGSTKATASISPCRELYAQNITVPGDISSAAYFIAAGLIVPDSEILIENVGINPTRAGILKVCEDMGGDITLLNERVEGGEKIADILVRTSKLHGITIEGDIIPTLIDEIPVIAVMAAVAEGTTVIKDAAELKVKETDRIETICDNLKLMGCNVTPASDGMTITGGKLKGASIHTLLDHRIAMAFSIAALVADGTASQWRSASPRWWQMEIRKYWTANAWMCRIPHSMIPLRNCCKSIFGLTKYPTGGRYCLRTRFHSVVAQRYIRAQKKRSKCRRSSNGAYTIPASRLLWPHSENEFSPEGLRPELYRLFLRQYLGFLYYAMFTPISSAMNPVIASVHMTAAMLRIFTVFSFRSLVIRNTRKIPAAPPSVFMIRSVISLAPIA